MAPTNPYLFLQRNADENPRGIFSRSGDATLTNAEAVVAVKKLAYELRRLGVRAGQVAALDLPDQLGVVFTEALYHEAVTGVVIPDGASADGLFELDWMFTTRTPSNAGAARIVTVDQRFLQQVEENPYGISPSEEPLDVLRIVFTSGTTGRPHAVALGRAMEQAMEAALTTWYIAGESMTLMDTGTAWGMGEFFLAVKAGHPYFCVGGAAPEIAVRLAHENGVGTLKGSPQQVAAMVDVLERESRTLPRVQMVVVAGTVLPAALAERIRAVTEGCAVIVNYGSTEAGAGTVRTYDSDDPFDAGHVAPGTQLEIVDDDDRPLPAGEVGVVRYRTFGMVQEYLGEPEATASAFRDGWFYPGDLGRIRPDGGLTLAGRASEVLNAGGVKVDPARIDQVALSHPGIVDACAFAYDTASGIRAIGLAVVSEESADLGALSDRLALTFVHAAPSLVARLDAIPRTAIGKPKRAELATRFREV